MQENLAYQPLALRRRAVQVLVAHAYQHAGQIAVGEVVLAEDPLGLCPRRAVHGAQRCETHREVAHLVLREEQREAQSLFVVLAPHPRAVHRLVR